MTDKYGSGGTTWTPIGTLSTGFNGEFDGAGHTVKVSLSYTDSTFYYIGLFGTVGNYISDGDGAIRNLGVSGSINSTAAVTAIGGIVGQISGHGKIESCYSSVNITGNAAIGGIAGMNTLGLISNCYNTGDITNSSTSEENGAGGIVGRNFSGIMSCYNTGKITLAESGAAPVGGIAGTGNSGTISNCYYLTGTAEKGVGNEEGTAEKVEVKTAEEFKKLASALNDGWGDTWKDSLFLGRPVFTAFPEGGDGKEATPYTIPDLATLEAFRDYINAGKGSGEYFKLTANIDMSDKYGLRKTSWTPIGSTSFSFKGTFDGDGHTISDLYISTTDFNQGLFGNSSGTIKNLTVSGSVTGGTNTGGIAGKNNGVITDCINNCSVTGNSDYVGGIVGYNYYSIINCYNTGTVSNSKGTYDDYVGGIAGFNNSTGSIENCHNKGTITGVGDYTGGIAGNNDGSARIENCYNTGKVSGASCVGGIAGSNQSSNFRNCYNTGEVSGTGDSVGGIVGSNSSSVKNCYYLGTGTESEGTAKTADQFASGEVAWLLQNEQSAQAWGQTVGDGYPELTDEEAKKVYKVTFMTDGEEHATRYANPNGTVTLPSEPVNDDHKFLKWSQSEGANGAEFNASTNVNSDMTVYAVWDESPFDGSGTAEDPYRIPDLATLEAFRDYINSGKGGGEYFKVTAEIDMSATYNGDGSTSWTPVGTSSKPFNGIFDGGGHTISGLYINVESSYQGLFGYSSGTIKNLTVSGSVTGDAYTGGIVGSNHGVISDCISNCAVSGSTDKDYIGGITGYNDYSGSIKNCYNTGTVSSTNTYIGGIAGSSDGSIENCYYLDTSCNAGGGGTSKTAGQFSSGEVAWLLQNGQDAQVWGQKLGGGADEYPVLTSDANKKVLKVTFAAIGYDNYAARYANPNGTVTLPENPPKTNYTFVKWATTQAADGAKFDEKTPVTGDMTVYAVGREHFGGDSSEIVLNGTYGYGAPLTVNLDEHMKYANTGISSEGKFEYSIASDEKRTGASISGSTLTVPTGLGAGEYTIQITAKEKAPQYALMSMGSYGTEAVTLTVKVSIAKANATVTAPTANAGLTYTGAAQALVTAGSAVGGVMRYSLDGSSYSADIPTGTEAKTYTVWYKAVGDGNHNDTEPAQVTVTIGKASPTVTAPVARELTYTGAAQQLITAGKTAHGALKYAVGVAAPSDDSQWETNASQITGANAGTYSVWYKVVGDANHNDTAARSISVAIGKASAAVTAPEANTLTYNGEAQELITGGSVTSDVAGCGEMWYSLDAESGFGTAIPTGEKAGTYTVYWKVNGADTVNYDYSAATDGQITITIGKAAPEVTAPKAKNLTYTGEELELVTAGSVNGGTMEYSLDGNSYSTGIPKSASAGDYTVWYKVVGDANHTNAEPARVTVTIGKAQAAVTEAPTAKELTYTGEALALVTSGEANFGSLVYSLDNPAGPFNDVVPTGKEAGTYTVYYKVEGSENWDASDVGSVQVEIKKAASAATVTGNTDLTYSGEAQALVTVGSFTGGTVVYALGDNTAEAPAEGYQETVPTGTNAGTYYVWWKVQGDANHNDTAAQSVTVTVAPFALTLEPVAAETPYTGAAISVTVSQTAGEAPAIDPAKIAVSYEQDGAAAEPVLPGTYDVLVTVTDPNFTLAGTAKVGTLTVTHVHVYAEAWTHDTEDHWHVCQGVGECDAPRSGLAAHVWDEGVVTLEPTAEAEGNRLYTCGVCGAIKNEPISKLDTFRISGVVTNSDGNPLAQAAVRLTRGQVIVAETVTDSQGRYSFSSVPAGLYNVAATWETVTKTILVELSDADANERDIQMPEGKVSSVVEVLGEDTPDVVVGGVDAAAEAEAAASSSGSVTVTLTVEKKDTPDDKEALEAAASSQAAHLTYLDMTLTKTTTGTGSSEEPITETGVVLEIVIPFDFTSKNNVTVYRSHGNEAAALTKADGDARIDGTFRLDEAGGKIYIYASKFSTYAIGYTPAPPALPPYPADVVQTEHGSLEVSPSPAAAGSRVTVTVTPDEGYEPGTLTVTDRSGNAVSVEDNGDGTFTFVMPAGGVEVEAIFVPACKRDETCPLAKFTDAAPTAWYHDGVHYCVEHGLMVGTSATEFAPDMPASRAMIVVILWREEGCPVVNYLMPYDDVAPETWYTEAVRWATSEGIVGGYGNGHFGPDDPITREQLGVMLWRYAKNKGRSVSLGEDTNILSFKDFGQISEWAVPALQWAAGCGILQGKDGVLDPQGQITRAQAADMLQRFFTSKKVAPLTTG